MNGILELSQKQHFNHKLCLFIQFQYKFTSGRGDGMGFGLCFMQTNYHSLFYFNFPLIFIII